MVAWQIDAKSHVPVPRLTNMRLSDHCQGIDNQSLDNPLKKLVSAG